MGRGRTKTGARKVRESARANQAVQLRAQALSYGEIAERLGYSGRSGPYMAVRRELMALQASNREFAVKIRDAECAELDGLLAIVLPLALKGDLDYIEQARKLLADRRKLFGVDADKGSGVPTPVEQVDFGELRELLREAGWEIVPAARETTGEPVTEKGQANETDGAVRQGDRGPGVVRSEDGKGRA